MLPFFLVVAIAVAYTLFDNEYFGELVRFNSLVPAPVIREVEEDYFYVPTVKHQVCFHQATPMAVISVLEEARQNRTYLRIHYGNPDTGREERSVAGFVNCSVGAVQVPLISATSNRGGTPIVDHRIVRVEDLTRNAVLYQHPGCKVLCG